MRKVKQLIKRIFGESFYVSLVNMKRDIYKKMYLGKEHLRMFV